MLSRAFLLLLAGGTLFGASIAVTVKDPSGSAVEGATATVDAKSRLQAVTDSSGIARFPAISAGNYRVSVTKDGFERWERTVSVADQPVELVVTLHLKLVITTVQVSGRRSPLANSDPNYVALRNAKLIQVYRVNRLELKRDVGTFTFRSGSFSFLPPVMGQVVTGVFVGDGNFQLKPSYELAVKHLHLLSGLDTVDEDFSSLVVYFSDSTFDEIKQHSELADEAPEPHEQAFKRVKDLLERRRQPSFVAGAHPLSPLERYLNYEDAPNYDAELLAELYNPAQRGSFRAFLHGKKHSDLRFLLNPRGAMAMLPAPEEVALLYFNPGSNDDGVWYLSHLTSELESGQASSNEDKRLVAPEHYKIEAFIGKGTLVNARTDLAASCEVTFRALAPGTRMVKFDMVPDLQVSHVLWEGKEIPFIQEGREQDGSFYLQMPEALQKGRSYTVSFEYSGGEILQSRYGLVPPRRVWYPTPAGAASRATYDLTFHVPHGSTIVTVGDPAKQWRDGGFDVTQWICDAPIQQAVFRYLEAPYFKAGLEETTRTKTSVYVNSARVGYFVPASTANVLKNAGNSLRVFNQWFGKPGYDSLSVIVSPGWVDSLPGMVYTPPVLTQDYSSLYSQAVSRQSGHDGIRFQGVRPALETLLDEAFPAQVAQQWWGNTVSPITFHDAWLAGGFADFSATLFDLAHSRKDSYDDHWVKARDAMLHPRDGVKPDGPLWMGVLNDRYTAPGIGDSLARSKGGFILHMLQAMMWDAKTGDDDFRAMMRDYLSRFTNQAASTDDFETVVEKHMKPVMDLEHNHRMDWFFRQWVYGTDIPSYQMEYGFASGPEGKTMMKFKLTQSGVSPDFAMPVPIFAEYPGRWMRVGVVAMYGNYSGEFQIALADEPKQALLNLNHDVLTDREEVKRIKP